MVKGTWGGPWGAAAGIVAVAGLAGAAARPSNAPAAASPSPAARIVAPSPAGGAAPSASGPLAAADFGPPAGAPAASMCLAGPGAAGHTPLLRGFGHAAQAAAVRHRRAMAAAAARVAREGGPIAAHRAAAALAAAAADVDDGDRAAAFLPLGLRLGGTFATLPTAVPPPPTAAPPTAEPPPPPATAAPTAPAPTAVPSPTAGARLTYWQDIRPILKAECATCHTAGGIGPFALDGYDDAVAHAAEIAYAVEHRIMPPLPAVPDGETPIDDPRVMADADRAAVLAWLAAGAPEGDPARPAPDRPAPPAAGPPDLSFDIGADYTTKAGRLDDYRCFVIDPGFRRDTEIRMVDVMPSNPRIYHHGILYLALASDAAKLRELEAEDREPGYECFGGPGAGTGEWIVGEAVGRLTRPYPDGTAKVIPAGAKFVLQLHYNTLNGHGSDRSQVHLWTARRPVNRAPADVRLVNFLFQIPAGSARTVATAEARVVAGDAGGGLLQTTAPEGKLWQVWGHMHLLGSRFALDLVKPDGSQRRLLDIPDWAFNWQGVYDLVTPIELKAGDRIKMTCTWDNSPANQPFVDGRQLPPRTVRWGEGTLDEMCLGGVTVTR